MTCLHNLHHRKHFKSRCTESLHLFLGKGSKKTKIPLVESKTRIELFVLMGLSPDVSSFLIVPHFQSPFTLSISLSLFLSHTRTHTHFCLVRKPLACFLPATGGAPLVLALHTVNLTALLSLSPPLPEGAVSTRGRCSHVWKPVGGTVLLEPLLPNTDRPAARPRHLSVLMARHGEGGGPALRGGALRGHRDLDRSACLIEMLSVDLPEAAGS